MLSTFKQEHDMNPEEFENVLKKTISPGKCREALIGSGELESSNKKFTVVLMISFHS